MPINIAVGSNVVSNIDNRLSSNKIQQPIEAKNNLTNVINKRNSYIMNASCDISNKIYKSSDKSNDKKTLLIKARANPRSFTPHHSFESKQSSLFKIKNQVNLQKKSKFCFKNISTKSLKKSNAFSRIKSHKDYTFKNSDVRSLCNRKFDNHEYKDEDEFMNQMLVDSYNLLRNQDNLVLAKSQANYIYNNLDKLNSIIEEYRTIAQETDSSLPSSLQNILKSENHIEKSDQLIQSQNQDLYVSMDTNEHLDVSNTNQKAGLINEYKLVDQIAFSGNLLSKSSEMPQNPNQNNNIFFDFNSTLPDNAENYQSLEKDASQNFSIIDYDEITKNSGQISQYFNQNTDSKKNESDTNVVDCATFDKLKIDMEFQSIPDSEHTNISQDLNEISEIMNQSLDTQKQDEYMDFDLDFLNDDIFMEQLKAENDELYNIHAGESEINVLDINISTENADEVDAKQKKSHFAKKNEDLNNDYNINESKTESIKEGLELDQMLHMSENLIKESGSQLLLTNQENFCSKNREKKYNRDSSKEDPIIMLNEQDNILKNSQKFLHDSYEATRELNQFLQLQNKDNFNLKKSQDPFLNNKNPKILEEKYLHKQIISDIDDLARKLSQECGGSLSHNINENTDSNYSYPKELDIKSKDEYSNFVLELSKTELESDKIHNDFDRLLQDQNNCLTKSSENTSEDENTRINFKAGSLDEELLSDLLL